MLMLEGNHFPNGLFFHDGSLVAQCPLMVKPRPIERKTINATLSGVKCFICFSTGVERFFQ